MAKVIWKGWVTDPEQIAEANSYAIGPLVKRDGTKVICLTPKQQRLLDLLTRPKMADRRCTGNVEGKLSATGTPDCRRQRPWRVLGDGARSITNCVIR